MLKVREPRCGRGSLKTERMGDMKMNIPSDDDRKLIEICDALLRMEKERRDG